MIDLREQHFAEGIGWFDQRALALEPAQLKQLQALLNLKSDAGPITPIVEPPATIPFPGPRDNPRHRPAAGSEF